MGEPGVARSLIQGVDTGNYTPKLLQVAMQAALATGDPAGLCPLGDVIDRYDDHTAGWPLVRAMCAALGGHAEQADAELAAVRRRREIGRASGWGRGGQYGKNLVVAGSLK